MNAVTERPDGTWKILGKPQMRTVGRWVLLVGLVLAIPSMGLTLVDSDAWPVWLFSGTFVLVGALFARVGRVTYYDPHRRVLTIGRQSHDAAEFIKVVCGTDVRTMQTQHGTTRYREWTVALLRGEPDPERVERVQQLIARIETGADIEDDSRARILAHLRSHRHLLEREQVYLTTTGDERDAWRLAERLGRSLGKPVLDLASGGLVERSVAQLDESLRDRLRREGATGEEPGPAPEGLEVDAHPGRLTLRWRSVPGNAVTGLLIAAGFGVVGLGLAVVDTSNGPWFGGAMAGFGFGMCALMLAVHTSFGPNELHVDAHRIRHTAGWPRTRTQTIAIDALEQVRRQDEPVACLSLISDAQVIQLPATDAQCRWIRRRLERWLLAHPAA